ncbi:hypothetical protein PInf_016781 [Phytophthora infestans]|nr:hypothetical protein PInf_016781 [Phytophthora infestans]
MSKDGLCQGGLDFKKLQLVENASNYVAHAPPGHRMEPTEPGGTPMDVDDGFLNVQHAAVNARAAQYAIHDRHGFAGGEDVEMGVPGDGSAGEADGDADDDVIVSIFLLFITHGAAFGTLDWRSLRAPPSEQIVVRSDFYAKLKEQRSLWAYRKTLRCMPASFDALCSFLGPFRYIKRLEKLLYGMMDDVIYFPSPTADDEWGALGFYDKSGKPSYNCLAAIDFRYKFRYIGVFSGSNSDQSMWNQSVVLGARARDICPPGVNWLGDAGFKLWPFLMVPFDERGGKRLTKRQRSSKV